MARFQLFPKEDMQKWIEQLKESSQLDLFCLIYSINLLDENRKKNDAAENNYATAMCIESSKIISEYLNQEISAIDCDKDISNILRSLSGFDDKSFYDMLLKRQTDHKAFFHINNAFNEYLDKINSQASQTVIDDAKERAKTMAGYQIGSLFNLANQGKKIIELKKIAETLDIPALTEAIQRYEEKNITLVALNQNETKW